MGDETTACVFDCGGGRAVVAALRNFGGVSERAAYSGLVLIGEIAKDPSTCVHLERFGGCSAVMETIEAFGFENRATAGRGRVAVERMSCEGTCNAELKILGAKRTMDRLKETHRDADFGGQADAARFRGGD